MEQKLTPDQVQSIAMLRAAGKTEAADLLESMLTSPKNIDLSGKYDMDPDSPEMADHRARHRAWVKRTFRK